ncbi:MAG: glycosyltransferase family 2 protein [Gammaproteobacteria bacterium]|nr:glycosyltransferase family 2 protein [Gammaproteobacteria bacterium]
MSTILTATIVLLSVVLIVYHHAIYPLLLQWMGRRRKPDSPEPSPAIRDPDADLPADLPSVTVIIPAYNEQDFIADKIRNIGAMDYPPERLAVRLVCDGCSDRTADIARLTAMEPECRHLDFDIIGFAENRGKVAVLNDSVLQATTDIVVLSDVSALVSIDAIQKLAQHFADPRVGVVSSNYQLLNPGSSGEDVYWRYQRQLKQNESVLGGLLGAHGAFYAFRRALFQVFEPDTINDDFILPMRIIAQGYRGVYAPDVNALELECASDQLDTHRRRRIAAGNLQQLLRLRELLRPRYRGVAFAFASGKALRVLMPWLMLIALLGSVYLAPESWLFALLAAGQLFLYGLAAATHLAGETSAGKLRKALYYLVRGHASSLVGSIAYLFGCCRHGWQRG